MYILFLGHTILRFETNHGLSTLKEPKSKRGGVGGYWLESPLLFYTVVYASGELKQLFSLCVIWGLTVLWDFRWEGFVFFWERA